MTDHWQLADARVKRSLKRRGELLTIALTSSTLCTWGRILSNDEDIDTDDGSVLVQGVLRLQLAWSDASQIVEGNTVKREQHGTTHAVTSVRKLNDANGRVNLQAAA